MADCTFTAWCCWKTDTHESMTNFTMEILSYWNHYAPLRWHYIRIMSSRMISSKERGGAVSFTENPAMLNRWMLSGPEVSQSVTECEKTFMNIGSKSLKHLEQTQSCAAGICKRCEGCSRCVSRARQLILRGQKWSHSSGYQGHHVNRGGGICHKCERIGQEQFNQFITERQESCTTALSDTVH